MKPFALKDCPSDINPRFWLYAKSRGRTVPGQILVDKRRWPGGCMTGFILWMGEQWRAFCALGKVRNPDDARLKYGADKADRMFDQWLCRRVQT